MCVLARKEWRQGRGGHYGYDDEEEKKLKPAALEYKVRNLDPSDWNPAFPYNTFGMGIISLVIWYLIEILCGLKFRTLAAAVGWYVSLGGGGRINHILGNVTFSPAIPCAILGDAAEAVGGELIRL